MADERLIIINSLLCFGLFCLKRQPIKLIKSVILDYYTAEQVSEAKERLINDIDGLNVDKWTKPAKRRGDNKTKQEIEDIITSLTFIDENLLLDKLPRYATDNLDCLPLMRMERGEFAILVSKLDLLNDKFASMQISNMQMNKVSRDTAPDISNFIPFNPVATHLLSDREQSTDYGSDNGGGAFNEVIGRKKRKHSPRQPTDSASVPSSGPPTKPSWSSIVSRNVIATVNHRPTPEARSGALKKRIIGKALMSDNNSNNSSTRMIRAAKPFLKKAVFAIHNVDSTETETSIHEFINNVCDVKIISCFAINTNKTPAGSLSFRVCIDSKDIDKLFDADAWADGIVIKEWRFKPKTVGGGNVGHSGLGGDQPKASRSHASGHLSQSAAAELPVDMEGVGADDTSSAQDSTSTQNV